MEKMRVSSPHGHQGPHGTQGVQANRGKSPAADGASAGAGGNFLSLLSALGNELLPEPVVSDVLPTDIATVPGQEPVLPFAVVEPPATDLTTLLAWQQGLNNTDAAAPTMVSCFTQGQTLTANSALTQGQGSTGDALTNPFVQGQTLTTPTTVTMGTMGTLGLLQRGTSGAQGRSFPGASVVANSAPGSVGVLGASGGGELGLVAQTAAFDAVGEAPVAQNFSASNSVPRRSFARGQSTLSQPSDLSHTASVATQKLAAIDHQAQTNTLAALSPTQAQATTERRESAPWAGAGGQSSQTENSTGSFLMAAQGMIEAGRSGGFSGRGGNGSAGSNSAETGSSWGVGGAVASPTEMGFSEIGPSLEASLAQGPEKAVAEQVAYWVNENIQNAELTVDHEGHPVEVSVSLTGNEAHVTFRSDQSETRDLLDASMAQLRELLRNEGLELSGVTVGSSGSQNDGSGDSGGRRRDGQSGGRQAQVEVPTVATRSPRANVITDRAVDIFV